MAWLKIRILKIIEFRENLLMISRKVREFVKFQAHPGALAPFFASLLHVLGD
jgi:hypothetical protein